MNISLILYDYPLWVKAGASLAKGYIINGISQTRETYTAR